MRKPEWLKVNLPEKSSFFALKSELKKRNLHTVCEEANCPNITECWEKKTATVMILGDTCTRACKFCNVKTGNPKGIVDPEGPKKTSELVSLMDLDYVVITSVDRDDLADGGASYFASVIEQTQRDNLDVKIEVLIPDFDQNEDSMITLGKASPFVVAQNIETVRRLTHPVRDRRAGYEKTLNCLKFYKEKFPHIKTKSSIMVGLGESVEEIKETLCDLRKQGVDIVTFGQYLRPTMRHLPVERYYLPSEFDSLKKMAYQLGFEFVASGPLVRSSYKAAEYLDYLRKSEQCSTPKAWESWELKEVNT